MRTVTLDERLLESSRDAHDTLCSELGFPDYYGANLSALADCLGDVCEPVEITCVGSGRTYGHALWFNEMAQVIKDSAADNECIVYRELTASKYDASFGSLGAPEAISPSVRTCLERLSAGNRLFVESSENCGDISAERITDLFENGQHPFATVICCADSRVVPEHIFMCGLGDIFTIRVAGNIISGPTAASAVYACGHLKTKLLVLLGHTACGAIAAALEGGDHGSVNGLVHHIQNNIGSQTDPDQASIDNVTAGLAQLRELPELAELEEAGELVLVGALYHADTGLVDIL